METFAEIRDHVRARYQLSHEEPFMLGLEVPVGREGRRQNVFLAEIKDSDNRRFLRLETTLAPLADHDPEKCLRVNLMLRVGYLAVGDLESVAFIKMCENLAYRNLDPEMLDFMIARVAEQADGMEETLTGGGDWF